MKQTFQSVVDVYLLFTSIGQMMHHCKCTAPVTLSLQMRFELFIRETNNLL